MTCQIKHSYHNSWLGSASSFVMIWMFDLPRHSLWKDLICRVIRWEISFLKNHIFRNSTFIGKKKICLPFQVLFLLYRVQSFFQIKVIVVTSNSKINLMLKESLGRFIYEERCQCFGLRDHVTSNNQSGSGNRFYRFHFLWNTTIIQSNDKLIYW